MHDDDSDEALMLRYQAGDAAAFDVLYARHRGGLFRFITRQCRTRAHAEELFQEVWMNLIQARERYRAEAQFRTYLFTLAHHRLVDYFRRHGLAEVALSIADNDDQESSAHADGKGKGKGDLVAQLPGSRVNEPQVRAQSREQSAAILCALEALPTLQREAFLMSEEGGLSIDEIAAATACSPETAKSRVRYAISKLRESLREYL